MPAGTSITVRDLFFNIPARKKFLKAESTELSHIASLVTHYALAHPDKHFELHSATNAMLVAPPVAGYSERVYQVFGKEVLDQLIPDRRGATAGTHRPAATPAWRRKEAMWRGRPRPRKPDEKKREPARTIRSRSGFGEFRVHGFVSKPEIQKLNRNSIYVFVNGRLIRDRLIQHAIIEAYRNILPPTVFPVVLLFLDLPSGEVDVNVHPSKTEVRFRQQSVMHDFVRDSVRAALMKARPVPQFAVEISAHPTASPSLAGRRTPNLADAAWRSLYTPAVSQPFSLQAPVPPPVSERFQFGEGISVDGNAALSLVRAPEPVPARLPMTLALRPFLTKRKLPAIWPRRWPRSNRWDRSAILSFWR